MSLRRIVSWLLIALAGATSGLSVAHDLASKVDLKRAMLELQEETHDYYGHPRSAKVAAVIEQGHAQVRALAKSSPEARRIATVVFRRGLSSKELDGSLREYRLLLNHAKVMFSLGGERDFSSELPLQILYQHRDSELPVTDWFIEENRKGLRTRAEQLRREKSPQAGSSADKIEKLVKQGKPVWLSANVIATADMLRLLAEDEDVYAVVMDPSAEKVSLLDDVHRRLAAPSIHDVKDRPRELL